MCSVIVLNCENITIQVTPVNSKDLVSVCWSIPWIMCYFCCWIFSGCCIYCQFENNLASKNIPFPFLSPNSSSSCNARTFSHASSEVSERNSLNIVVMYSLQNDNSSSPSSFDIATKRCVARGAASPPLAGPSPPHRRRIASHGTGTRGNRRAPDHPRGSLPCGGSEQRSRGSCPRNP